jgi:hypothetical protein
LRETSSGFRCANSIHVFQNTFEWYQIHPIARATPIARIFATQYISVSRRRIFVKSRVIIIFLNKRSYCCAH